MAGTSKGAVILLHGVHANKKSMLSRARLLVAANYSVPLIDLQIHGESEGDRITSLDVAVASTASSPSAAEMTVGQKAQRVTVAEAPGQSGGKSERARGRRIW
jgi:alpha-beta hydrolase superfamily lysophospholipase